MYMIDLPLDAAKLMRFAWGQGHGRTADEDFGYAVHAWLAATLGEIGPKPFRLLENRHGLRLLGYTALPLCELVEHAHAYADPSALGVCDWLSATGKAMPANWSAGRRLGFEVRVCPISRAARERDVFLVAISRAEAEGKELPSRPQVYADWLARQLMTDEASTVESEALRLVGFRRVRGQRNSRTNDGVKQRGVERPDALFTGELIVHDPDAFAHLLARGIGRHRAFGFGMLLLRPPSTVI